MMVIRVRLFAILRDAAGAGEFSLELPAGATVSAAMDAVVQRVPALKERVGPVATAVNQEYAGRSVVLRDGDELALIPPVSGG